MPYKQALETFACNIKADVYKLTGDAVLFFGTWIASYEKWAILHGFTLMFTFRFGLLLYDIYGRSKDVKKEAWETQVKPILKSDALTERKKSIGTKLWDIVKLMFFR